MPTRFGTTLENDHPDNVIIVAGSNDVAYDTAKGVADAGVIADRILQIAADAKAAGVQEVFISSIMKRRGKQYMNIINDINIILQLKCLDKGYHFVDNSNISLYDLSDGLHLNPYGNIKFMGNLLRCCESYNPYLDGDYLDCHEKINCKDTSSVHENNVIVSNPSKLPAHEVRNENKCIFDNDPGSDDVFNDLRDIRIKNIGRVIVATLNINSIAGKFEQLKFLVTNNIDVLILTETKIDNSFPERQFIIDGYSKPYRLDRNSHGGGIIIYVREDIPSKELKKHSFPDDIEGIFIEINLRKTKLLIFGTYHPPPSLTKAISITLIH